jgi:hypothetical protein
MNSRPKTRSIRATRQWARNRIPHENHPATFTPLKPYIAVIRGAKYATDQYDYLGHFEVWAENVDKAAEQALTLSREKWPDYANRRVSEVFPIA